MTQNNTALKTIIRFLGSLNFAIFLIASLVIILIASTSLESKYGTPFAQKIFYQAGWFDVFLGLLAANIFCSALTRFPYKKKHTGFIVTHIGILILLAGCLMSSLWGVDGQMALLEGEKSSHLLQNTYVLTVQRDPARTIQVNLKENLAPIALDAMGPGLKISIDHVVPSAKKNLQFKNGGAGVQANAAVELSLESQRVGAKEKFWLVENNPLDADSNHLSMGPATIALTRVLPEVKPQGLSQESPKNPALILKLPENDQTVSIDLSAPHTEDISLNSAGLKIQNLIYYPHATVGENNKLINASENPSNPAVEFDLLDGKGKKEHVIFFSLFPNFESMHGRSKDKIADLHPQIQLPAVNQPVVPTGPSLTISTDGSRWFYVSRSSKSTEQGELSEGKTYETGWMDFHFTVHQLLSHAVVQESIQKAGEGKGYLAASVSLSKGDQLLWQGWLFEDEPLMLEKPLDGMALAVRKRNHLLPFTLTLKDFRKVDYPSTQTPMSFESDVVLEDAAENTVIQKTISMNKPLDYKGYRIFQSSYVQDPDRGEGSIFTIAKNPGIRFIYIGACVTFLGILTVFFIKPLSSFNKN